MITTPESNAKFTSEQESSLAEYQKRLTNVENEINIAGKNLIVVKKDIEKAVKEKIYQEGLVKDLEVKTEVGLSQYKELSDKIESSKTVLIDTLNKAQEASVSNQEKDKELQERESKLVSQETEHSNKVKDLSEKTNQLSLDQSAVKTAKDAFLKAIESVNWK